MPWWERNNLRLIQTNLRAGDAATDRESLIKTLKKLSANVLLLNTGGLTAFYPSKLDFHYKSPWLNNGDLVGDMISLCHKNAIHFMARFDFSKIHESIYGDHPEWAYCSAQGKTINYNGMVHTCINGEYQRKKSLLILKEVLETYNIDGVFFNMFGYITRDYSNEYYGICQCESCKRMFFERYGKPLPKKEDISDPVFRLYQQFKEETVREVIDSVRTLVKSKSSEIAVSTYTDHAVDIVKKESNTEIHRPYPLWEYSASENVQSVEGSWNSKLISNVCINAVGLDYRFQGVQTGQVEIRLYQALAAGSGMDFCIIGVFDGYPDRKNFSKIKKIYGFHKENEIFFGNFKAVQDVLLIKPSPHPSDLQMNEYLGLFKILKEQHIPFTVCEQHALCAEQIKNVKLLLCADLMVTDPVLNILETAKESQINLMWTGTTWNANPPAQFLHLFSIAGYKPEENGRWSYLSHRPKEVFPDLSETDWSILDGPVATIQSAGTALNFLERVSAGQFGPPELCGGNIPDGTYTALSSADKTTALLAFYPGYLYKRYGFPEHSRIVSNVLKSRCNLQPSLQTNAPEAVEIFFNEYADGIPAQYNVQMINLSGFNGSSYNNPIPIFNMELTLNLKNAHKTINRVYSLISKTELQFTFINNKIRILIAKLEVYDMLVLS